MKNKVYLKELSYHDNVREWRCANCIRKPKTLYRPNRYCVIDNLNEPWEICRQCLNKLFTLSKSSKKDK